MWIWSSISFMKLQSCCQLLLQSRLKHRDQINNNLNVMDNRSLHLFTLTPPIISVVVFLNRFHALWLCVIQRKRWGWDGGGGSLLSPAWPRHPCEARSQFPSKGGACVPTLNGTNPLNPDGARRDRSCASGVRKPDCHVTYLPPGGAVAVSFILEVRHEADHPVVDLGQGQPLLRRALDGTRDQVRVR